MINVRPKSGVSSIIQNTMASYQKEQPLFADKKSNDFVIKIANTLEEREAAFRLAYEVYLSKGYIKPNFNQILTYPYDKDPESTILIILDSQKNVVGSVTLVFDNSTKLPAEKIFGTEIQSIKTNGEKLVELCRLVISPHYRNSKEILVLLFNYLIIYSYFIKNFDGLVVEVHPKHKNYYKNLLKFDEIGSEKFCPQVQGTIGVLMHLPLIRFQEEVVRCAGFLENKIKDRTLYPYFIKPAQVNLVVYYLKKQKRPISEEEKIYFGLSGSSQSLMAVGS